MIGGSTKQWGKGGRKEGREREEKGRGTWFEEPPSIEKLKAPNPITPKR